MGTAINVRNDVYRDIEQHFGVVPKWIMQMPDGGLVGFWNVMKDFHLAETKIPNKYKELIGLAVSGAVGCPHAALFHAEAARLFGATDEEIAEASFMAGVATCASTYLNAEQIDYDSFKRETLEVLDLLKNKLPREETGKGAGVSAHA